MHARLRLTLVVLFAFLVVTNSLSLAALQINTPEQQPTSAHDPIPMAEPSPGTPDASGIYPLHNGNGVSFPQLIHDVPPEISEKVAVIHGAKGVSTVSIIVDIDGRPKDARIFKSAVDTKLSKKLRAAALLKTKRV